MVAPTRWFAPEAVASRYEEAVEVCERCGLILDEWQRFVLRHWLGVRENGKWAAREVGLCMPRQNGKGALLEAREIAGLFVFGERTLIHSAHDAKTSNEAFKRMRELLEEGGFSHLIGAPSGRKGTGFATAHGAERVLLKSGQELQYRTRTKVGGRGFSGDLVIFDEAMILPEAFVSALGPTISAKTIEGNPQIVYTGSSVDQFLHDEGLVFAAVRQRGLRGDAPSLAWFEWSADADPAATPASSMVDFGDPGVWRRANPGLGIRISEEYIQETERDMLGDRGFAVERLGIGDWPDVQAGGGGEISLQDWLGLIEDGKITGEVVLAFDVSPARTSASICAAGRRDDGLIQVELIANRQGTGWVVPEMVRLVERHHPANVLCHGPARSLIAPLVNEGVAVHNKGKGMSDTELGQACGQIVDLVNQKEMRHLGSPELSSAVRGADTSPLGDSWRWSRKRSTADITPLVAATEAVWWVAQMETGDYMYDPSRYWAAA